MKNENQTDCVWSGRTGHPWQVWIDPRFPGRGYGLYFFRETGNLQRDEIEIITAFEIQKMDGYKDFERQHSLAFDAGSLQHLMDSLWKVGFRPSEGTGSAGSLKATQDHLKSVQEVMNRTLGLVEKGWRK